MIDKLVLYQIKFINTELKNLKERLQRIENSSQKITDVVKGSSAEHPYTQHNCKVEGLVIYPQNRLLRNKYKKLIKEKQYKLEKLKNELEYNLNNIPDSEIRQIIRYKYEDDMNWVQIMFKMNYKSESTARMKLERFLKNN